MSFAALGDRGFGGWFGDKFDLVDQMYLGIGFITLGVHIESSVYIIFNI